MSETNLLIDTAERIFADHCDKAVLDAAERGDFPETLWNVLVENGLHEMALKDSGIPLADVFAVIKVAGRHALPLPLAEALLANRWRERSDGFASVGKIGGVGALEVPWGRRADCVLAADTGQVHELRVSGVAAGANLAGEPRDDVEGERARTLAADEDPLLLLALTRTLLMAGALERVLELSLAYATEREQFGRPISKFQAIQHNLAVMAAETAAAIRAADAAAAALDGSEGERLPLEIAAGKARVGEACGVVAELAHQVHGAMGYTHEHQLHHFTRRLWAWRDEFGAETHWQRRLGSALAARGADALWDFLATRA
jgi:acyl-CoA dehydrogenase